MPDKKVTAGLIVPRETLRQFNALGESVSDLQRKHEISNQRFEILEKHAREMQTIPATVSGLNSKVESLQASMVREVDGLREQQKAHKEEMGKKVDEGFAAVGSSIADLSTKVGGILTKDQQAQGIKIFLFKVGACIGALLTCAAAVAEIIRAFHGGE